MLLDLDIQSATPLLVDPIRFYNRYTEKMETEKVYGEAFLDWTYNTPFGKIPLHLFVKRPFFSKWYGKRMNHPKTKEKIAPFIDDYDMDAEDFLESPQSFPHFNAFFYRKLKPEARPVAASDVVFPADGRHLGFEKASDIENFFVKGQQFDLKELLQDDDLYSIFRDGSLILSRLCPVDYHRFHFPVSGTPGETRLINGPLFSVSPIALRKNLKYLWQNKRTVCVVETEHLGKVAILEIGATCVGSIHQTYAAGKKIEKAAEKGYFSFGGSSTITLFEPGKVELASDLLENTGRQIELYALMGDELAKAR